MKKVYAGMPVFAVILSTILLYLTGCSKTEIKTTTTDDVNIVGYLDKHLDSFSLFRQILTRSNTADYLNAYGAYTCFAVTNSGVKTWLNSINASSVDVVDVNVLKDLVRFHLIEDTLTTPQFTDGKLPVATMYGQYLIAGITQKEGVSSYIINRQGVVLQSNLRVGNGIIHVIDHVLQPARMSLAKRLEADPQYSIFLEAVKATGYYGMLDSVNTDTSKRWLTLVAESNNALADSGISSFAQLKNRYSRNGNPLLPTDTFNLYIRYHILPGLKFLGDLIISPSQETLAPQEVVSVKLINQEVYLNDDVFNGVHEQGILLNRTVSDMQATNGVLHDAKSHYSVKFRKPEAVFWDVSDFDEIRKLPAYYRKASYSNASGGNGWGKTSDADRPIKDIDWMYVSGAKLEYFYGTSGATAYCCNNDYNALPLGATSGRPFWVDYRTPVVIKGRYKVWICYRQGRQSTSSTCICNVLINGVAMQRPFNFTETRPGGSDGELEAINYKRYTENTTNVQVGRCVGIVDIPTTGRQTLRIAPMSGTQNSNYLDMVHFIPVDQNQILPRFKPDGSKLFQ